MPIQLPATPHPLEWTPRLITAGTDLETPYGKSTQRIVRLGDKIGIDASFLKVPWEPWGNLWKSRLAQAANSSAIWTLPRPKAGYGTPGAFVVDGGGQQGTQLSIKSGAHAYAFKEGRPFNVIHSGLHYLHFLAADATSDGSGNAVINFWPMLRVVPSNGDALDFATPKIEGFCPRDPSWPTNSAEHVSFSLTINEAQ